MTITLERSGMVWWFFVYWLVPSRSNHFCFAYWDTKMILLMVLHSLLVYSFGQHMIRKFIACITKTCLYNFDPIKPHFYIVKLGFTGVYIIFLISAEKHRLWVLVRTAVLTSTHNLCFEQKYEKISECFIWKFSVFGGENFYIFE